MSVYIAMLQDEKTLTFRAPQHLDKVDQKADQIMHELYKTRKLECKEEDILEVGKVCNTLKMTIYTH